MSVVKMKKQTGFIELIIILIVVLVVATAFLLYFFAEPLKNTKQLIYKKFVSTSAPKLNNPQIGNGADYKLRVGWNLIYLPFEESVTSKLDNANCKIEFVLVVKSVTSPDVNKISQAAEVLTGGKFYQIQCKEQFEFNITGQPSAAFPQITDGWQLTGLPKGSNLSVSNFLTWAQTTNDTLQCSEVATLSADKNLVKMSPTDQISDQTGYWLYCQKRM